MSKKSKQPDPLRTKAEVQLTRAHAAKGSPRPAGERLHELQVHQIELEIQNENLRQAQIALEESRDRYVNLYEFAPVGYLTLTRSGMISEINLTGTMLLGVERNKLLQHRFTSLVAPECRDRWSRHFLSALKQDDKLACEIALRHGDGHTIHARLDCMRLVNEGEASKVHITLTDITQSRRAEETMREWQMFVECAHWGMIFGSMEDRKIRLTNPAYASMHGYTMEELHGVKIDNLYAPESRANIPRYDKILRSDSRCTFECVRLRKDGSTFPAIVDISTMAGADGMTLFIASVTDITASKRAEAEVVTMQSQLKATLDAIPDMLFEMGLDGRYFGYHSSHPEFLATPPEALIGKTVHDILPPKAADVVLLALREANKKGNSFGRQIELQLPPGKMWFELSVSRKLNPAGQKSSFIVLSRDITARKQMEQQLRNLTAHLQAVREGEKASIAREIHDELGGTLTALKMETYFLAEALPANQEAAPLLGHVELMAQLTDSAMSVTRRIITGLRPTILDDLGLLAALEWEAGQFHKRTGIECRVNSVGGKNCKKELDKTWSINLFRIFQESLTNISRHAGASRVEVELHQDDKEIMLSISDNGRGMTERNNGASKSNGIPGMYERVEQLGGTIKFGSTVNIGSTPGDGFSVMVVLPLHADRRKEARA